MGERELCKLEVVGSIPIDSTILRGRELLRRWKPGNGLIVSCLLPSGRKVLLRGRKD